jgi:hypothetical protein
MNGLRRSKVVLFSAVLWGMTAWGALKSEATATPLDLETLPPPQRLFKAIQLVNWSHAEQKTTRNFIESHLRESGWNFTEFSSANPTPADPDVRLVARVDKCVSLEAWLPALGKPTSVNVLLLHSVETVMDQNLALVTEPKRDLAR